MDLKFKPSDWDSDQTVTVVGVDDDVDNVGDSRSATISHEVTSSDGGPYRSGLKLGSVSVTVNDDSDTAGVKTAPPSSTRVSVSEGGTKLFWVTLESRPLKKVTIRATSDKPQVVTVDEFAGSTPGAHESISFTPGDWNRPVLLEVSGVDDDIDNLGDRSATVSFAVTAGDGGKYTTTLVIGSIPVLVTDDDATQRSRLNVAGQAIQVASLVEQKPLGHRNEQYRLRAPVRITLPLTLAFRGQEACAFNSDGTATVTALKGGQCTTLPAANGFNHTANVGPAVKVQWPDSGVTVTELKRIGAAGSMNAEVTLGFTRVGLRKLLGQTPAAVLLDVGGVLVRNPTDTEGETNGCDANTNIESGDDDCQSPARGVIQFQPTTHNNWALSTTTPTVAEGDKATLRVTVPALPANAPARDWDIDVPLKFSGSGITAEDYPASAPCKIAAQPTQPDPPKALTYDCKVTVPTDDSEEGTETLVVEVDAAEMLPLASFATGAARVEIAIEDATPTSVTVSVPDTYATENSFVDPSPAVIRLETSSPLSTAQQIEVPLVIEQTPSSDPALVAGTDYRLELAPTAGVSLAGTTVTFDGSGGDAPQTAEIRLYALNDSDYDTEKLTVTIPAGESDNDPNAPVLTSTGFVLQGAKEDVTGTGSGTITFIEDDPKSIVQGNRSVTSAASKGLDWKGGRGEFDRGGLTESGRQSYGKSGFTRDDQTGLFVARLGIHFDAGYPTSFQNLFFGTGLRLAGTGDSRGGFASSQSGEVFASDVALNGGEVKRGGNTVTVGPSVELHGAPAGLSIHSIERKQADWAIVTFRMTEAAMDDFRAQQNFQVKVGGMLLVKQDPSRRGEHQHDANLATKTLCEDNYDVSEVGKCRPAYFNFKLLPGADIGIVESDDATVLADTTGETDTYSITLDRAPSAQVTITPSSSNSGAVTVSDPLVFSPSDSGAALTKTVTVTAASGADNSIDNPGGSQQGDVTISHTVTTTDPHYSGLTVENVNVDIVDDEPTVVSLKANFPSLDVPMLLAEGASSGVLRSVTVEVDLGRQPRSGESVDVAFALKAQGTDDDVFFTGSDRRVELAYTQLQNRCCVTPDGFGGGSSAPALRIEANNNPPLQKQLVIVRVVAATDDGDTAEDHFEVALAGGAGAVFESNFEGGVVVHATDHTVPMTLLDDDAPQGIVVDAEALEVTEGEDSMVNVRLANAPSGNVKVEINLSRASGKVTLPADAVTFTAAAGADPWYKAQAVTVTGAQDDDIFDHKDIDLEFAISGDSSSKVSVPVTVVDDETPTGTLTLNDATILVSDFKKVGDNTTGYWRLFVDVTLGGDYVFARIGKLSAGVRPDFRDYGFQGTGQGNRRLTSWYSLGYQGDDYGPSIDLVGAPDGLRIGSTPGNSASPGLTPGLPVQNPYTAGLTVPGHLARGGNPGEVALVLTPAARTAITSPTEVTLRIGSGLIEGVKDRYGDTPPPAFGQGSGEGPARGLCWQSTSLSDTTVCPPAEATFTLVPLAANAVDAEWLALPDDLTIEENDNGSTTPVKVGTPVRAVDRNSDTVAYSLKSPPAGFTVGSANGQISYSGTGLDREALTDSQITLTIVATSTGADGSATGVEQQATITVTDVDEGDATVTLRDDAIGRVGTQQHVIAVSGDPDGDPAPGAITYQWHTTTGNVVTPATGTGAATAAYTVAAADAGKALTVRATYTDGGGNDEVVSSTVPITAFTYAGAKAAFAVTDNTANEESSASSNAEAAQFTITLADKASPVGDETIGYHIDFSGGAIDEDFTLELVPAQGVSLTTVSKTRARVVFSAAAGVRPASTATVWLKALADDDNAANETITLTPDNTNFHGDLASGAGLTGAATNVTVTDDDDPVTVTMTASDGDSDGNAVEGAGNATGYRTITLTLSRALSGPQTVTVPLNVAGATVTTDYTFALAGTNTGVTLTTTGGTHTAQNPAVVFAASAQTATLRLTPVDNSARTQPYVVISYGTGDRAPSGTGGTAVASQTGGPIGVVLVDDETGDIELPLDWGLLPPGLSYGDDFRLLFRTSVGRDATSSDIAVYDAFVRGVLAEGGHSDIKPYAGFFKVFGGTRSASGSTGTSARVHNGLATRHTGHLSGGYVWADGSTRATVGSTTGVPTYWLNGAILANNYADLCDIGWSNGGGVTTGWDPDDPRSEDGTRNVPATVPGNNYMPYSTWTGSGNACEAWNHPLGASTVSHSSAGSGGGQTLLHQHAAPNTRTHPFYGYSPVFKLLAKPPELTFSSATFSGAEGDGTIDVTVRADAAPRSALTVALATTAGTATGGGTDYTAPAATFTFPADVTSHTVSVTVNDDSAVEPNERFTLTLGAGTGYTLGTPASATVTIVDDDGLSVAVTASDGDSDGNAVEGASDTTGYRTITLTLGRALTGSETVTVPLSVTGATVATDYTFVLQGTNTGVTLTTTGVTHTAQNPAVVFAAGAQTATLRLTPVDNTARTQPYVIVDYGTGGRAPSATGGVTLGTPRGGPIGVVLVDDETGDVVLPAGASFRPTGVSKDGEEYRILFMTSEGGPATSTDIADYDHFVRASAIRNGNADLLPYVGFFNAFVSTPTVDGRTHVGIWDPKARGGLGAYATGQAIYWLSGDVVGTSYRNFCSTAWAQRWISAENTGLRHPDGTPGDGAKVWTGINNDCKPSSAPLGSAAPTYGPGAQAGSGTASQALSLGTEAGSNENRFYAVSEVLKTVASDEMPQVEFTTRSVASTEDGEVRGLATLQVSPAPAQGLKISYTLTTVDATPDEDYDASSGTVTIPAGQTSATFSIPIVNDDIFETSEIFRISLAESPDYLLGSKRSIAVTILDDEELEVGFERAEYWALEDSGSIDVDLTVDRDMELAAQVTLSVGGTAMPGSDFTALPSTTVTIPEGTTKGTYTLTISITADAAVEPDETITLEIVSATPDLRVSAATQDSTTVFIADQDRTTPGLLMPSTVEVGEGGAATYRLRLATEPTGTVTVTVSGQSDSVLTLDADDDTNGVQASVEFDASNWHIGRKITVSGVHDNDTDNDTVTLTHTAAGGGYASVTGTVTATVVDDDLVQWWKAGSDPRAAPAAIQTIAEGASLTLTVTRLHSAGAVSIPIKVQPDTAKASDGDYEAPATVEFANGQTEATYTFTALRDNDTAEGAELARIILCPTASCPAPYGSGATPPTIDVAIADGPRPHGISVKPAAATIALDEGGGDAASHTLEVSLESNPTVAATVTVTSSDPAAVTVDTDPSTAAAESTITFTPGTTGKDGDGNWAEAVSVEIAAVDDTDLANESVTVTFSAEAASGPYSSSTSPPVTDETRTVTVTDPGVAVIVSDTDLKLREQGGTATYTVRLATPPAAGKSVEITARSAAVERVRFGTAGSAVLSFDSTNWNQPQTVTLTGVDLPTQAPVTVAITHTITQSNDVSYPTTLAVNSLSAKLFTAPVVFFSSGSDLKTTVVEGSSIDIELLSRPAPEEFGLPVTVTVSEHGGDRIAAEQEGDRVVVFEPSCPIAGECYNGLAEFSIPTTADSADTADSLVYIALSGDDSGPGYLIGGHARLDAVVTDDDPTTVTLSGSDRVPDDGGEATITLTLNRALSNNLTAAPTEKLTVPLTFTGGTVGTDYSLALATANKLVTLDTSSPHSAKNPAVVFTGGPESAATAELTLTAIDTGATAPLAVSVAFGAGNRAPSGENLNGGFTASGSATATIVPAGVTVTAAGGNLAVTEAAGAGRTDTFTVVLTSQPAQEVTVAVAVGDPGVATVDKASLTFTTGNWSQAQTVTVTATDDNVDNPGGTRTTDIALTVTSTDSSYNGLKVDPQTVAVTDDEATTVTFSVTDKTADEGDPSDTAALRLVVSRPLVTGERLEVPLGFSGATPLPFTLSLGGTPAPAGVTLNADVTDASVVFTGSSTGSATVADLIVTPRRDADTTDTEITAQIPSAASGGTFVLITAANSAETLPGGATGLGSCSGGACSAEFTVEDDGVAQDVSLSVDSTAVNEGATATVTATLLAPATDALSIPVQVRAGATASAADYTLSGSGSIEIARGNETGTLTFTARDDMADEPTETLTLELGTLPVGVAKGTPDHVAMTIVDTDDDPVITVAAADQVQIAFGDSPKFVVRPITEGTPARFTVTATPAVQYDLPVTLRVSETGGDYVVPGDEGDVSVVIASGQTQAAFNVPTVADTDGEDDGTVTVGVQPGEGYTVGTSTLNSVMVQDDDATRTVSVTGGGLLVEGDSNSSVEVTVELSTPLASGEQVAIQVRISGTGVEPLDFQIALKTGTGINTGVTLPRNPYRTLFFSGAGAQTAVLVLTAGDDEDEIHEEATLTVSGAPVDPTASEVLLSVLDADASGAAVLASTTEVTVDEGATASYTVRLSAAPGAGETVTITPTSAAVGVATVTPASVQITSANWQSEHSFTVNGVDDGIDNPGRDPRSVAITHAVTTTGSVYASVTAPSVTAKVIDTQPTVVKIVYEGRNYDGSPPAVTEGQSVQRFAGSQQSRARGFEVVLSRPLARDERVEVPLRIEGLNITPADVKVDVSWQAPRTRQEQQPDDARNPGVTLLHSGVVYKPVRPTTLVQDWQDTQQMNVRGETVMVTITALDFVVVFDEASFGTPTTPWTDHTAPVPERASLMFMFIDDDLGEGREQFTLTIGDDAELAARSGTNLAGGAVRDSTNPSASVLVNDNDPHLAPSKLTVDVDEGGAPGSYTLKLSADPGSGATVTVDVVTGDSSVATVSPQQLTFTGGSAGSWKTAQTVTVTGVADATFGDDSTVISHHISGWTGGPTTGPGVLVRVSDAPPGFTVTQTGGSTEVTEAAGADNTDTYQIVLNATPARQVTVTPVAGSAKITVSAPLVFTKSNWNRPQTVTVTAVDDDAVNPAAELSTTVTHQIATADSNYRSIAIAPVPVAITDNDTAALKITESGDATEVTDDGSTDTITVSLTSQPSAEVTVTVKVVETPTTTAALALSKVGGAQAKTITLTFSRSTWDQPQTVTVTGVADSFDNSGDRTGSLMLSAASSDADYAALASSSVSVTILDDDTSGVTIAQTSGATEVTDDGSTDTYTVRLNTQPLGPVFITATSGDDSAAQLHGGTDTTPGETVRLTFTRADLERSPDGHRHRRQRRSRQHRCRPQRDRYPRSHCS